MRIKCVKCSIEKDISREDIDKIRLIAEGGQISRSVDYLEIFNVIRGKCIEQKKHTFIFEESFFNNVQSLIKKREDILSKRASDITELYNVNSEILELENKLNSTKEKRDSLTKNIESEGSDIENILQEFEQMTGGREIDIWS